MDLQLEICLKCDDIVIFWQFLFHSPYILFVTWRFYSLFLFLNIIIDSFVLTFAVVESIILSFNANNGNYLVIQ